MTDTKTMELIGELAENVSEKNLAEITYETDDVKIRVVGKPSQPTIIQVDEKNDQEQLQNKPLDNNSNIIISPMVGVVYLRPSPDDDVFVNLGDTVTEKTTVCIVEAMKTFNQIKPSKAGKIEKILVNDGDPVEYGTPLFELS